MEAAKSAALVELSRQREAMGGYRQNHGVGVRTRGSLQRPFRRFLELTEANVRQRPGAQHSKQQRIERTEAPRVIGRTYRGERIAGLGADKGKIVMGEREIRTE